MMKKKFKLLLFYLAPLLYVSFATANDCVFLLHGVCYDCNSKYALKVGSQDNCEINCPNRIYVFKDRTCRLKIGKTLPFPPVNDSNIDSSYCTVKKGEDNNAYAGFSENYFKDINGKCYPCNTSQAVLVSSEDCSNKRFCNKNCNQRIEKHYNDTNTVYSVLQCPTNRPLMDRFMMCWSCEEKTPIDLSFDKSFHNICANKRIMTDQNEPFSYLND